MFLMLYKKGKITLFLFGIFKIIFTQEIAFSLSCCSVHIKRSLFIACSLPWGRSGESTRLAPKSTADHPWVGMSPRWEHYSRGPRESTTINSQTQLPSQKGATSAQEVPKTVKVHRTYVRCSPGGALTWRFNKRHLIVRLSQQISYSSLKSQWFDQILGSSCHCCWRSRPPPPSENGGITTLALFFWGLT